jgi:uncharacterized protein (TIGR00255 family)
MLLSMTGHGEAHSRSDGRAIAVDVRTVNNKYFKFSMRAGDRYLALEPLIEGFVRQQVRRGTVQVELRIARESTSDDYRLNEVVLASYRRQLESIERHLQLTEPIRLESLLALPGVVEELAATPASEDSLWPEVEPVLREALERLDQMRRAEGRAMAADLRSNRELVALALGRIEERAPQVVAAYRARLLERVNNWVQGLDVAGVPPLTPSDIVREVGLFTDRSDISEEIVRLRSHLAQFDSLLQQAEPTGRKLDFLIQEMFREVNTIGSKANDVAVAREVIEIKTLVERMREMIQNVE